MFRAAIALVLVGVIVGVLASVGRGSSDLPEGMTGPGSSTTVEAAPPGLEPVVTEEEALRIASREEGRPDATSVRSELALLRVSEQGRIQETPVWIVVYEGVCVRAHGPIPSNECAASEWFVTVDATTGEFLVAGT